MALRVLCDREVTDPLLEERLSRIRAQIVAALALRQMITELGYDDMPDTLDLKPLVEYAEDRELLHLKAVRTLLYVNGLSNKAKHAIAFRSHV